MDHYGHGKGGPSIDHVNRNKLDNRLENLRITTQSVQNENRDKVSRHKNAKDLPREITEDLPKFVVYYKEKVSDTATREFFTVEGHPLQKLKEKNVENIQTAQLTSRRWATTKSNKVAISDKLEQAKWFVSELQLLMDNPAYKIKLKKEELPIVEVIPQNEIVYAEEVKQELSPILEVPVKEIIIPKQWKAKQIHEVIQDNTEELYKIYCEEHNDIATNSSWPLLWSTFVSSIKGKAFEQTEEPIKAFIDTLRNIRHNQLCYDKNISIVDKEDRQQWPTGTVVRAFLSGKLEKFKTFMETTHGEEPENPKWTKRWTAFTQSLEQHRLDEEQMKKLCSKFMTAQRVKRYREGKK
jgi:hypothetical protein